MISSSGADGGGRRTLAAAAVALAVLGAVLIGLAVTGGEVPPSLAAPVSAAPAATPTPSASSAPSATSAPSASSAPSATPTRPDRHVPDPTAPPRVLPPSPPAAVSIPGLGVRVSRVEPLGLQDNGELEVPAGGEAIGWYVNSPTPGEAGPSVLAAHVSWNSEPAVFFELGAMRRGERISVTRQDGATVVFEVTRVRQYPKDDFPTLEVYGNSDRPELRLITCGGEFDDSVRSHRDNIVVYARMVDVAHA